MSKDDTRALMESFSKPVKGSGMLYPVSFTLQSQQVIPREHLPKCARVREIGISVRPI